MFSALMGYIYTALSWLMLTWHSVWDTIGVGDWLATNWDWILAIVFMVLTVRGVLFPVFVKQIKSQRAMQALQPKIKELQEKHKGDKPGLAAGSDGADAQGEGQPADGLPPDAGPVADLRRRLPPAATPQADAAAAQPDPLRLDRRRVRERVAREAVRRADLPPRSRTTPTAEAASTSRHRGVLVLIMVASTYMTSRQMINKTGWATDPTQLMMQRLMLYVLPLTLIFSGVFFPLGAVVYYVVSNLFSLGQQFYVLRKFPPPAMANANGRSRARSRQAAANARSERQGRHRGQGSARRTRRRDQRQRRSPRPSPRRRSVRSRCNPKKGTRPSACHS